MAIISAFISVFALVALLAAFLGLFKPSLIKEEKRLKAFGKYIVLWLVLLIVGGLVQPEVQSPSAEKKVETASRSEPQSIQKITAKAHAYEVVQARDFSSSGSKGGLWHITSDANSVEDRAATVIRAAKDLFSEMKDPDEAHVWLYLDESYYKNGFGKVASAVYAPRKPETPWEVMASAYQANSEQKELLEAWHKNRGKFLAEDGVLDESALRKLIAKSRGTTADAVNSEMIKIVMIEHEMPKYDDIEGALAAEVTGGKLPGSVENPIEFLISKCQRDIQCWGEKHLIRASVLCEPFVERFAKYDAEWTDGWLEPKFSHFRWKSKEGGIVTYIGDKIKLQNGFGAWQNYIYECDYVPSLNDGDFGRVVDMRLTAGRL